MIRFVRATGQTLLLAAGLLLAAQSAALAQAAPLNPVGDFEYSTTVNGQAVSGVMSITRKDDGYTGKILSDMMPEIPISNVAVDGRKLTITAHVPDADGPLTIVMNFEEDNSRFSGSWSIAGDGGSISGKRKS